MVTLKRYVGRFGNNLFQYAACRLLSVKNGLKLEVDWPHDGILKVLPWNNAGEVVHDNIKNLEFYGERLNDPRDRHILERYYRHSNVILDGYFQRADYFNKYRDIIKGWFEPCTIPRNEDDWVISYRVTDYWHPRVDSVIDPEWHISILDNEGYFSGSNKSKVYIVTEDSGDPCVKYLQNKTGATIVSEDIKHDFNFIRSFDKIINANGSFSWWASFLGEQSKCYFFKKWMRYHNLDLAGMIGGKAINGEFAENEDMKSMDWDGYWEKYPNKNWMKK